MTKIRYLNPPKITDIAYLPSWMGQLSFPVGPSTKHEYHVENGNRFMKILAPSNIGLPYGKYTRLLICYVTTIAKITKKIDVYLGDSQAQLLRSIGSKSSGGKKGSIDAFRQQTRRLFSSSIYIERSEPGDEEWMQFSIASSGQILWNPDRKEGWSAHLRLSSDFFYEARENSYPICWKTAQTLSASPTAFDMYCWLTNRAYRLHNPVVIRWEELIRQFGNEVAKPHHFRQQFKRSFQTVLTHYPHPNLRQISGGILLSPFSPHVKKDKWL